jgi:Flp pilus assembly protein TadG
MTLRRRTRDRRRGATVVEMAFVLPIFLLFLIGILEYGRFLFFMHVASNATAQAARFAVVRTGDGTTTAQVQARVQDVMGAQLGYLTGSSIDVFQAVPGVTPPTPAGGAWNDSPFGTGVCVRITGNYQFIAGTLIGIPSTNVSISSVMTSEAN